MALSWVQKPVNSTDEIPAITNWTPLIGYMLYQSTIAGLFYYKLVVLVQQIDSSGAVLKTLGKIKQRRNGYSPDISSNRARAFFDLSEIMNTALVNTTFDQNSTTEPRKTIHTLGNNEDATMILSENGDYNTDGVQIMQIQATGSEFYATAANIVPTPQGSTVTETSFWLSASLPLSTPRNTTSDYVQSNAMSVFQCSINTDRFLSDVKKYKVAVGSTTVEGYINYVRDTDFHTLAFLNDGANFNSDIDRIYINYYDSTGSIIGVTGYIANNTSNGGAPPNWVNLEDKHRLLYLGIGPANLEAQDAETNRRPSNFSGWAYYMVQGTSTTGTVDKTDEYYFIKESGNCKGYKTRRLGWRNSLGCYDYFNFKMKSTQTINIKRKNYNSIIGTFNKTVWRYRDDQRGITTNETTANLKEVLQSDWITEEQAYLMEKLIYSTNVYIIENADTTYTEPVVITDSSFIRKTRANNRLIQYTINIEYANPINTNS